MIILIIFTVLFLTIPGSRKRIVGKLDDRIIIWKTALKMYRLHPITGIGAGQYKNIFMKELFK